MDEDSRRGEDEVFYDNQRNYDEFDDAAILAMCDDGSDDQSSSVPLSSRGGEAPPLSFGMEGSTINISHSKDIHFGPKTVAPPSYVSQTSSPIINDDPTSPVCNSFDGFSLASSLTSLNSNQFQSSSDVSSSRKRTDSAPTSARDLRLFRETYTERIPSSTHPFNLNSPVASSVESTSCHSIPFDRSMSESSESSMNVVRKSISHPAGNLSSASSTLSSSSRNAIQCLPDAIQMTRNHTSVPQMSAAINNSKNVHMGTQIVYNVFMPESEQRNPHVTGGSHSESLAAMTLEYLAEFREKLIHVYLRRTRSSPLPWHRGKQVIPISEYYTEPQIFAVNKVGNKTSETVDLISIISSTTETRLLVEGEAGMGKTLLATKLAEEWANGVQLQQFPVLLFITLADFKGSLQQYVREELLPSNFPSDKFEKVWDYYKTHDKEILFVLDGYDELERLDKGEIQNLMKNKDFPESKVVVTSRPNFLQDWEKKIFVNGFGQMQIMEFIEKYFKAIGKESSGRSLRNIIEKDEKYWKLAKRPLFCVLLCMLYITGDVGKSLPERQSDIMLQIILCLIKWNRKDSGNASIDFYSLPEEYEKPFFNFGKLCLEALETEKSRFSDQEVHHVEGFSTKLKQLGFLYNDNESHALGVKKFWKPVHQTFLEYLGAFYIAKHIMLCNKGNKGCKECKSYNLVFQRSHEVLKFCVGILNNNAYKVLDGQKFPILRELPAIKILQLLREAEPITENCSAVAKLVDQNEVEISTSEIEFEGWSHILSQLKTLTHLQIAWRIKSKSPDQESSFTEASKAQYNSFFRALKDNESVKCIHVRAKQDGEPFTKEKMEMFFTHLQNAFLKKNLNELHVVDMKIHASSYLRKAFEKVANLPPKLRAFHDLKVLKLNTFMKDNDLMGICEALGKCALSLESLHLDGLEHGHAGFQGLVKLLKGNSNIKNLNISMDQSLLVEMFRSRGSTSLDMGLHRGNSNPSEDYGPREMRTDHMRMYRNAGRRSKHAFTEHTKSQDSDSPVDFETNTSDIGKKDHNHVREHPPLGAYHELNPRKELKFLFEKIPLNTGLWVLEAMHYWYLRKTSSQLQIPLPLCVHREHKSVFHFLFMELPNTHIRNLTLKQAGIYLSISDLICLGDAIRSSSHLSSINLQGLKAEGYLPLLIGMGQSHSVTTVNFSSSNVTLTDTSFEVMCAALEQNTSLKNLSLGNWRLKLQNSEEALQRLTRLLQTWQVTKLDLKNCSIELGDPGAALTQMNCPASPISEPFNAFFQPSEPSTLQWKSLKTLSLEGVEVKEQTGLSRRGHLLLVGLTNFVNLTSLDLSMSQAKSIQVDTISLRRFFGIIEKEMKQLVELKLGKWEFCLQLKESSSDFTSTLHSCKKLKKIELESVNEEIREAPLNKNNFESSGWCKLTFLHHLIACIPNLEEISLCYYKINQTSLDNQDLALRVSQCLRDHWNHKPFIVKFFSLPADVDNIIFQTLSQKFRVKQTHGPALTRTYEAKRNLKIKL